MFDLLILDIDGVMTSGDKYYDDNADVIMKKFNDRDFTAIKRFKMAGVKVCFLSGDARVNKSMAKDRGVDFYLSKTWVEGSNKASFIPEFVKTYDVCASRMAYVGDDFYDVGVMSEVGHAYCPSNSPRYVKNVATSLAVKAGDGVVASLYDLVFDD
jgi:3-deoxy-D-manno-octulosonate 8-phosphate phosphatase (KDO 8-P phosphatase)